MDAVQTDMPGVEVLNIKRLSNYGNLKAFADIRIGALEIHGLRIVQQPNQRAYVQFPVVEYTRKDSSERMFAPLIRVNDKTLKEAIQQAVLLAWEGGKP